ncbi:MAG TPA: prepilin-type N-terminal cleavage/methylation domain-containing protein [Tissierellaceae bacterium]|mgnify:CR=1 FL=1
MLNLKPTFLKNKGFTILELLLAFGISSIIVLSLVNILYFSKHAYLLGNEIDELILNGRYAIEYIKDEVKSADKILSSNKIEGLNEAYKENVGFVVVNKENEILNRYTTYYKKGDKLVRISGLAKENSYPIYTQLEGHNEICESIYSFGNTGLDVENKMIYLDFLFLLSDGQVLNFRTNFYIRCPIEN